MIQILLIIHIFIAVLLVGTILIQKSEGGGLGSSQQASMFTPRGGANFFTRLTVILAATFAASCLLMGIILGKKPDSMFKNDINLKPVVQQKDIIPETPALAPTTNKTVEAKTEKTDSKPATQNKSTPSTTSAQKEPNKK